LLLEHILPEIEVLSKKLQTVGISYHHVRDAVVAAITILSEKRTESAFISFWSECLKWQVENNADEPKLPRQRNRPQRYEDGCEPYNFVDAVNYYRHKYFETVDLVQNVLSRRFDQGNFSVLRSIETVLMSACRQDVENSQNDMNEIAMFYKNDFPNTTTMKRHLQNLADLTRNTKLTSMTELVSFLKENKSSQVRTHLHCRDSLG